MVLTLLLALVGCPTDAPEATTDVAPAPVDGVAPPATGDAGAAGQGVGGTEPKLDVVPGEGVKLSGTATYDGEVSAPIRLDVLKQGESNTQRVHTMILDKFGPFELELPKNFGTVQIAVLVDSSGPAKPMAITLPIVVGDQPINDIVLALAPLDSAAAPPVATGAPPAEGAPPPGSLPPDGAVLPPPAGAPPAGAAPAPAAAPPG